MEKAKRMKRKAFVAQELCVACSWCVYCPMGTMTQLICKVKNR